MAELSGLRRTLLVRACLVPWLGAGLGLGVGISQAAGALPILTILDGEARLIDGSRCLAAAEGLKLGEQTLLETSAKTRLLRVEWPDGSVADFGPDTRAMLAPKGFGQREQREPAFYLLRGWVKQSAMGSGASAGHISLAVDVQPFKGALVSFAGPGESWVFLEAGTARITERQTKAAVQQTLASGEVYNRAGLDKGTLAPRPTPAQMQRVPRGFRDTLPLRATAFKNKTIEGKPMPLPAYAELREWLTAEPALRKDFPQRFAARAREAPFREAMLARVGEHPEWERLLRADNKPGSLSNPAHPAHPANPSYPTKRNP